MKSSLRKELTLQINYAPAPEIYNMCVAAMVRLIQMGVKQIVKECPGEMESVQVEKTLRTQPLAVMVLEAVVDVKFVIQMFLANQGDGKIIHDLRNYSDEYSEQFSSYQILLIF